MKVRMQDSQTTMGSDGGLRVVHWVLSTSSDMLSERKLLGAHLLQGDANVPLRFEEARTSFDHGPLDLRINLQLLWARKEQINHRRVLVEEVHGTCSDDRNDAFGLEVVLGG